MGQDIDSNICSECGTKLLNDKSCQNYFDTMLAKEFSDPEYGAVHHLSVPAYMLQHPSRLSKQGWAEMRKLLVSFVQQDKSPDDVRKSSPEKVQNSQRDFSFTKGESMELDHLTWTQTICDIRMEDPSTYRRDVKEWAKQILKDTEEL